MNNTVPPLSPGIVASRQVSPQAQDVFAAFCGDRNPVHMDWMVARRTQAGAQVVHGIHTMLWALESLVARGYIVAPIVEIKIQFLKWSYLQELADLILPPETSIDPPSFQVRASGVLVLIAGLKYGENSPRIVGGNRLQIPFRPAPFAVNRSFEQLKDCSGYAFVAAPEDAAVLFPQLSAVISATAVAELAACSYVVGMECPGLHSIFSKLRLLLGNNPGLSHDSHTLHYQVISCDERFHKACIGVTGRTISGSLEAFLRTPPVEQPPMQAISARVESTEFVGMKALIVGGSRGLGELTAKLIAAGGGIPTITYVIGKTDAENVARQIGGWGGNADVMPYDVLRTPSRQLAGNAVHFTHLFYFATNSIFKPKGELLSAPTFASFAAFYLHGFHDLSIYLVNSRGPHAGTSQRLIAFYPSSTAIDERPTGMTEYAMVKAAGEQMCLDMNRHIHGLFVLTSRLPRMRTDQTASVIPEPYLDPISILLPIARNMMALSTI